ncbi:hypothetical protein ACFXG8_30940, partial [Kitasatospora indigofera]|uniref:hypothetical protein n=1 Tax=Kitasatospora indigofera TaxID=67307 RepID=UPI0036AD80C4
VVLCLGWMFRSSVTDPDWVGSAVLVRVPVVLRAVRSPCRRLPPWEVCPVLVVARGWVLPGLVAALVVVGAAVL